MKVQDIPKECAAEIRRWAEEPEFDPINWDYMEKVCEQGIEQYIYSKRKEINKIANAIRKREDS